MHSTPRQSVDGDGDGDDGSGDERTDATMDGGDDLVAVPVELVRALYDFNAEDPEEISFEVHELLRVVSRDDDGDGWWRGYNAAGELGFFPSNYVTTDPKLVHIAEAKPAAATTAADADDVVVVDEEEEDDDDGDGSVNNNNSNSNNDSNNNDSNNRSSDCTKATAPTLVQAATELELVWASQEEDEWRQLKATQEPAAPLQRMMSVDDDDTIFATVPEDIIPFTHSEVIMADPSLATHAADFPPPLEETHHTDDLDDETDENVVPPLEETPQMFMHRLSLLPKTFAPRTDPELWTKTDVAQWLRATGFAEFCDAFINNDISGEALLELDQETLKEMQFRSIGRRIKLLLAISRLKEHDEPASPGDDQPISSLANVPDVQSSHAVLEQPSAPKDESLPHQTQAPAPQPNHVDIAQQVKVSPAEKAALQQPVGVIKVSRREVLQSQEKSKRSRHRPLSMAVPDITAVDVERPEHTGWLWKQGGNVRTWKRRWFTLSNLCLYYFKAPQDAKALGMVLLPSYSIMPAKEIKRAHAFKAFHNGARTYYFCADTETEMNLWIKYMQRASMSIESGDAGKTTSSGLVPPSGHVAPSVPVPAIPLSTESKEALSAIPPVELLALSVSAAARQSAEVAPATVDLPKATKRASEVTNEASKHDSGLKNETPKRGPAPPPPTASSCAPVPGVQQATAAPIKPPVPTPMTTPTKPPVTTPQSAAIQPTTTATPPPIAAKPTNISAQHNISAGLQGLKKVTTDPKEDERQLLEYLNKRREHFVAVAPDELTKDSYLEALGDGLILIALLESASKDSVGKYNKAPKMAVHKLDNVTTVLRFLDKHGVALNGTTSDDVTRGDRHKVLQVLRAIERKWPL